MTNTTISNAQRMGILSSMLVLIFLINIDYSAVNIAMVTIAEEIHGDLQTLQWVLSGYILAWGLLVIPAGRLADIYGKRRLFIYGVGLFTLSSILCGLATSSWFLIFGRVLQGFGGALFIPPLYSLLFTSFPPDRQGFALGLLGVGAGAGLAAGPSLGGILLTLCGWRWIFFVNVPLCLAAIFLVVLATGKDPISAVQEKLDKFGSVLFATAMTAVMLGLNYTQTWGIDSPLLWSVLGGGLLGLAAFCVWQQVATNRLIPAGLLTNRVFVGCTLGFAVYCLVFAPVLVTMGLYLQNILGYSAYESGLIFLAMTLALGALSPVGGKLADKMDVRIPIVGGMLILAVSLFLASRLTATAELSHVVFVLFLVGLGLGLCFPVLNAAMMKAVKPEMLSTASGVFVMAATVSNSLGVILCTNLIVFVGKDSLTSLLNAHNIQLSSVQYEGLVALLSSLHQDLTPLNGLSDELLTQALGFFKVSFVDALSVAMLSCAILSLLAAALATWLIRIESPASVTSNVQSEKEPTAAAA